MFAYVCVFTIVDTIHEGEVPAALPDPYHVTPEDFLHDTDVLHIPKAVRGTGNRHTDPSRGKHRHVRYSNTVYWLPGIVITIAHWEKSI